MFGTGSFTTVQHGSTPQRSSTLLVPSRAFFQGPLLSLAHSLWDNIASCWSGLMQGVAETMCHLGPHDLTVPWEVVAPPVVCTDVPCGYYVGKDGKAPLVTKFALEGAREEAVGFPKFPLGSFEFQTPTTHAPSLLPQLGYTATS